MEFREHLFSSIALSIVLYPFFGVLSLLAMAGGFLIDVDHYIYYVMKVRDWNLRKAVDFYRKRTFPKPVLSLFHTIEVFIPLFILSIYYDVFAAFFAGYLLHLVLDLFFTARHGIWGHRCNSVIVWLVRHRKSV